MPPVTNRLRIPAGMIQRLAEEYKLDIRKWSAASHVVALMYGQLAGKLQT